MVVQPGRPLLGVALGLRSWLLISHLLVLLLPLLSVIGTGVIARELQMQAKGDLLNQSAAVASLIGDQPAAWEGLQPALLAMEEETGTRTRLLDADGRVVQSPDPAEVGTPMSAFPEVSAALRGEEGLAVRPRESPDYEPLSSPERGALVRMTVARPLLSPDGAVVGVVVVSRTPREVFQALFHMRSTLIAVGVATMVVAGAMAVGSGHLLSRSLRRLSRTSRRLTDGQFDSVEGLIRPAASHVSEVRELAVDMARMAEALRERLRYITEFAGNVSHEFKTPITTLRGTVELLAEDPDMPAEQRLLFVDNALVDLRRMDQLVSGLLALARAEEGGGSEVVDLDEVLSGVAERWPEVQRTGRAGAVRGRPHQLDVVLENLVANAFQHGGPGVRVALQASQSAGRARIEVVDDGPGISLANQEHVFERFFTTDREGGGTGLGLALVRAICRAHRGDVQVASAPGRTVFTVDLPFDAAGEAPPPRAPGVSV